MEQQIMTILTAVTPAMYWMFAKVVVAFFLVKKLNDILTNGTAWFMFKSNKKLSPGVKVQVNGDIGIITDYDWNFIHIDTENGDEMLVPIARWKILTWKVKNLKKELYRGNKDEI